MLIAHFRSPEESLACQLEPLSQPRSTPRELYDGGCQSRAARKGWTTFRRILAKLASHFKESRSKTSSRKQLRLILQHNLHSLARLIYCLTSIVNNRKTDRQTNYFPIGSLAMTRWIFKLFMFLPDFASLNQSVYYKKRERKGRISSLTLTPVLKVAYSVCRWWLD